MEKSVGTLDSVFRGLSPSSLSAVAGITALIGSLKALKSFGAGIVNMASHFEQTEKGLETVLQSAEKGKQLFEDLRKFSFETTFGVDELASASTQLLNVGVGMSDLKDDLRMIGDLAQGDKAKFSELTSVFAKIQASGKAGAMQLQQIALRGIPINQTLKEMGVTGTATAKDITEAFKKLTAEGGNFHGAMEKINDTIEGKRGFISDTLKEINVNLGEITGLTDLYKKYLDALYEVLNNFNNKLMELNENPVVKAIIEGILITALGGIVGIIVGSLLPALGLVVAKLVAIAGLKAIITGGLIGLAVGGITALGVAMVTASNNAEDLTNKTKDYNAELENQIRLMSDLDRLTASRERENEYKGKISEIQAKIDELEIKKTKLEQDILAEKNKISNAKSFAGDDYSDFIIGQTVDINALTYKGTAEFSNNISYIEGQVSELDNTIADLNSQIDKYNTLIKGEENVQNTISPLEERAKQYKELKKSFEDYVSSIGNNKQIKELEKQLREIEELKKLNGQTILDENGNAVVLKFDDKQKSEIDKTIDYLKKQLENIKIKNFVSDQKDWQKLLQSTFGFSDKQVYNGATSSGVNAVNEYLGSMNKRNANLEAFGLNKNKTEVLGNVISDLEEKLNKLALGVDEAGNLIYDGTEQSIKMLQDEIQKNKDELFKEQTKETLITGVLGNSDAGTFYNSMKENDGNVLKALTDTVVNSLISIIGNLDGIDLILNPISFLLEGITPTLQMLVNIISVFFEVLEPIVDIIREFSELSSELLLTIFTPIVQVLKVLASLLKLVYEIISPILDILTLLVKAFQVLLYPLQMLVKAINNVITWLSKFSKKLKDSIKNASDSIDELMDTSTFLSQEQETEAERLKKINEQYKSLLESMRDQEEYYLEQKKIINAETYKSGATSVNDMILTPHGNFSTAPDDYIIATKNPSSLGGNVTMNVQVNNTISDVATVDVSQSTNSNGMQELIVSISKKVASDFASGKNGWKSAYDYRMNKIAGRSVQ